METTDTPDTIKAPDGTRYYAPSTAAKRLGRTSRQIDRLVNRPDKDGRVVLRSTRNAAVIGLHHGPGRPPGYLVLADDVERMRRELLSALDVDNEISTVESELAAVRAAWEHEVIALRARVDELERQRDSTFKAFEKRLAAAAAQAEADREFLRAIHPSNPASSAG